MTPSSNVEWELTRRWPGAKFSPRVTVKTQSKFEQNGGQLSFRLPQDSFPPPYSAIQVATTVMRGLNRGQFLPHATKHGGIISEVQRPQ